MCLKYASVAAAVLATACQNAAIVSDCICTASFATVPVTVLDTLGAPVSGLNPSITAARTGRTIVPSAPPIAGGRYYVVTDHEIGQFDPDGDTLRFIATSGLRIAAAQFAVAASGAGACRCHVQKNAGPDSIVLR